MHTCLALAFTPAALPPASSGVAANAVASNIPTRSPTSQAHGGRAAGRQPAAMQQLGVATPVQPAPAPRRAARVHAACPLAPYPHETLECPPSPPARVLRRGSIVPAMTHTLPCAFAHLALCFCNASAGERPNALPPAASSQTTPAHRAPVRLAEGRRAGTRAHREGGAPPPNLTPQRLTPTPTTLSSTAHHCPLAPAACTNCRTLIKTLTASR